MPKRLLTDNDGFIEIKIFIDKTYINSQNCGSNKYNKIISSIDKCVNTIQIINKS